MSLKHNQSGNVGLIVIGVIVGLVVGFGVAKATNSNDTNSTKSSSSSAVTTNTKAATLRSDLTNLGVEHMMLTNQAVDAALDSSPNATQLSNALNQNGKDIGAAVGSVYGADAEKTFDQVWQLHLDQFVAYAVADSKGDAAGKTAALDTIKTKYTQPLAQFLAKANPNLPEKTVEQALDDHVQMTAGVIDDHVQGKYDQEAADMKEANKHISDLMSTLAGGIVKQYPNKFQG